MRNANPLDPLMKWMKRVFLILLIPFFLIVAYLGTVIWYAGKYDFQPPKSTELHLGGHAEKYQIEKDTLKLISWNIGYGGQGATSDFFFDGGKSVRMQRATVEKNLKQIKDYLRQYGNQSDLILIQEADIESRRSHYINQMEEIATQLPDYSFAAGKEYDAHFVPVPYFKPLGKVKSYIAAWSRFQPIESYRYSLEGTYSWPSNLYFPDNCYVLQRFPILGEKQLVVINVHLPDYDNGRIRKQQLEQLKSVLLEEAAKGNLIIAGGDWNHYLKTDDASFEGEPNMSPMPTDFPASDWHLAYDPQSPTHRRLDAPLSAETLRYISDFFLLSPGLEALSVNTRKFEFAASDHNPVELRFALITDREEGE